MLHAADVISFLIVEGLEHKTVEGRELPPMPDRIVAIFPAGGAPTSQERAYDNPQFQVVCRGKQGSPADAEIVAERVDDLLLAAFPPVLMNGKRVISVDRFGGPPQVLDQDTGRRSITSCSYLLSVARTVL